MSTPASVRVLGSAELSPGVLGPRGQRGLSSESLVNMTGGGDGRGAHQSDSAGGEHRTASTSGCVVQLQTAQTCSSGVFFSPPSPSAPSCFLHSKCSHGWPFRRINGRCHLFSEVLPRPGCGGESCSTQTGLDSAVHIREAVACPEKLDSHPLKADPFSGA